MSQQKQWREELAQSAPAEPVAPEEEEREALPDIDEKQGSRFIVFMGVHSLICCRRGRNGG